MPHKPSRGDMGLLLIIWERGMGQGIACFSGRFLGAEEVSDLIKGDPLQPTSGFPKAEV